MDLERFAGIARCYGTDGYVRLAQARVCVVGIGGVGSWVAEALARSGVGHLRLIDLDDLCVSNSNRQLPALAGNFGVNKAEAMATRIQLINPACQVEAVADFVTAANVQASLADVDAVIDACDTLVAKQAIVVAAKRLKLPCFVSGAAGGQIDPGQIASADLSKVIQDPLLAKLRRELRAAGWPKDGKKMAVPCVYSTEQPRYPSADGGTQAKRSADAVGGLDCGGGLGASMPVTATFAMHLVALCLARLTR